MPLIVVTGGADLVPTAMTKNNAQAMPSDGWAVITGWIADAGFPGSVVVGTSNEGLKAIGAKDSATLNAAVKFSGATTGFGGVTSLQARLRVNNVTVATSNPVDGPSGTMVVSATVDIASGDIVTVEANATVAMGGAAGSVSAGATTYVRLA
ncbi:hypothetical protein ACWIGI_03115 [Nocardia sp. NPDC055321]